VCIGQRVKVIRPFLLYSKAKNFTGVIVEIGKDAIYPIYVKLDNPVLEHFNVYACRIEDLELI
jgi:hypothetical protein